MVGVAASLVFLYESQMTYMALYVVLSLPVLSLLLVLVSKRRFSVIGWLTAPDISKGEQTKYILDIVNHSFMPASSLRVRFRADHPAVTTDFKDVFLHIPAKKSKQIEFNVFAKHRGHYELGVENIVLYDFLGLFKFRQKYSNTATLVVRPPIVDIKHLPLVTAQSGTEDYRDFRQQEDYTVVSDLRKYQPTDGYKRIHWKVSAKRGELTSKVFQTAKRNTAALILDNSKIFDGKFMQFDEMGALAVEDAMMEAYVSVLSQSIKRGQVCNLFYLGSEADAEYSADFTYLFSHACAIEFSNYEFAAFEEFLTTLAAAQLEMDNLIIFVKEITEAVFAACSTLKMYGNNVILIYFKNPSWQQEKIKLLQEMNIEVMHYEKV